MRTTTPQAKVGLLLATTVACCARLACPHRIATVKVIGAELSSLRGRDVIVVEDIIDSGTVAAVAGTSTQHQQCVSSCAGGGRLDHDEAHAAHS